MLFVTLSANINMQRNTTFVSSVLTQPHMDSNLSAKIYDFANVSGMFVTHTHTHTS